MPQDPTLEALSRVIRHRYEQSWARILRDEERLLADWTALRRPERLARLRELRTTVEQLMDAADELALRFTSRDLPKAYQLGAQSAAAVMHAGVNYTHVDVDAVNQLAVGTNRELLGATSFVKRSTKDLIRKLAADHLADKLIRGLTAEQAARNLRIELEGHGITSVVYSDGSRHGLAEYTDMLTLTRSAESYQVAGLNQSQALGVTFMEIFDGFDCVAEGTRFLPYGELRQIVRARFSGRAYTITASTPSGAHTLTVGPNHPILTSRGWVRAHLLAEGDQLVYDTRTEDPAILAELDLEEVPVVEDVFAAASETSPVAVRSAASGDLHGDAVFCEREVDVVTVAGSLLVESDPSAEEHVSERPLVLADARALHVPDLGGAADLSWITKPPSHRLVGGFGPSSPFLGSCPRVPSGQCLAGRERDAHPVERGVDALDIETEPHGDLSGGHAFLNVETGHLCEREARHPRARARTEPPFAVVDRMERDAARLAVGGSPVAAAIELAHGLVLSEVLSIVPRDTELVVYDATTTTGAFSANGFVVKNCGLRTHDDPQKANGLILPIAEARNYPLSHPRCGRSTSPRANVRTAYDAEHAQPSTTAAQRADQAAVEQARAQSVADRAAAKRFENQITRRADGILTDQNNRINSPAAARALARREALARRRAG